MIKATKIGDEIFLEQTTYYIYRNEEDRRRGHAAFVTSDKKKFNEVKAKTKKSKKPAIYWNAPFRTYPLTKELRDIFIKICSIGKYNNVGELDVDSANHLFDDNPDIFGITALDGHKVRVYFHQGKVENVNFENELNFLFNIQV